MNANASVAPTKNVGGFGRANDGAATTDSLDRRLRGTHLSMTRLGTEMRARLAEQHAHHGVRETQQSYERLALVLEESADFVLFGDVSGRITSTNSTACRLLGKTRQQLLGTDWELIYAPNSRKQMRRILTSAVSRRGAWKGDIAIESDQNGAIATSQVLTAHKDDTGAVRYFSLVARDLRDRHAFEERIHRLRHFDAVTGLPTLQHVRQSVDHLIAQCRGGRGAVALITLNLDGFRLVDEGFGRAAGDEVLKSISLQLRAAAPERDVVARICADEFLVTLSSMVEHHDLSEEVQRLLNMIAAPRLVAGQTLRMSASAGIAIFPTHGGTFEALLGRSHAAMCQAKTKCHGGLQLSTGNVQQLALGHLRLETDLRDAIGEKALTLHYQPQCDIRSGRVCGVEALARWTSKSGQVIAPNVFVPLAEQSGLIGPLGAWVLHEACTAAPSLGGNGTEPLMLCVNVSSLQLGAELTTTVTRILASTNFPASRLEFELTETALLIHPEFSIKCLMELKQLGVRIALDDFGTGYSSLSYLSRLPVDRLKIDQTLIKHISADVKTAAIVRTIITLGKELGLLVIAEGVETMQQLEMLERFGCEQAQGYLLGMPLPQKEATAALLEKSIARAVQHPLMDQRTFVGAHAN
jgi:diguanylate cyclase (GGDEF)-like protein/PAS domain S-box-containing protein